MVIVLNLRAGVGELTGFSTMELFVFVTILPAPNTHTPLWFCEHLQDSQHALDKDSESVYTSGSHLRAGVGVWAGATGPSGWRPAMLLNTLLCTGHSLPQGTAPAPNTSRPEGRNPELSSVAFSCPVFSKAVHQFCVQDTFI